VLWRKAERELEVGVSFPRGRTGLCPTEDAVAGAGWRERGCGKPARELGPEGPRWMMPSASHTVNIGGVVAALSLCEMRSFMAFFFFST